MTNFITRFHRFRDSLLAAFEILHRIQFSAPWTNSRPRQG